VIIYVNTIKENTRTLIDASKKVGLEVNTEKINIEYFDIVTVNTISNMGYLQ
jgi:hypothetical protein